MNSSSVALLATFLALSTACSSQIEPPRPTTPVGAATTPIAPSVAPPELGAPARDAFDLLHAADAFEDTHVGYSGALSRFVAAFRVVLADANAAAGFHALVASATPAGQLYGASGLYFADPPAFDAALTTIASKGGAVTTGKGCSRDVDPVAAVIRTNDTNPIVVANGTTLDAWFAAHPKGGMCDVAGGCMPLSFVGDGRAAPRDPAR